MDQSKEIAVLRAVGYTKYQIKRLYFYETFILVLSSSILGILIGTMVGWTMTIQQTHFMSLPLTFYFPYKHLIATSFLSLICAFIAVYSPISYMLKLEISEIFRLP